MSDRVTGADTALWVAWHRALETRRPDALFRDPLAQRLAGERGEQVARHMNRGSATRGSWTTIVRTSIIDELLARAVGDGVDLVVNLAAGHDTRPYRLVLPSHLRWVEVDTAEVLDRKDQLLAGEEPRCTVTRLAADLRDPSHRADVLARALQGASRALVLTEGLLVYLPEKVARELASELHELALVRCWITDLAAPLVRRRMHRYAHLVCEDAQWQFAPSEGVACFEPLGWRPMQVRAIVHEAARLRRLPWLLWPVALFDRDPQRPWGAVVCLQRG